MARGCFPKSFGRAEVRGGLAALLAISAVTPFAAHRMLWRQTRS